MYHIVTEIDVFVYNVYDRLLHTIPRSNHTRIQYPNK